MKVTFTYHIDGKVKVTVDAKEFDEAEEMAEQLMVDADFGPIEDVTWCEDCPPHIEEEE